MKKYIKRNYLIIIILFFLSNELLSQTINFEKKTIAEINTYEKQKKSILIDTIEFGILRNPHFDLFDLIQTKALIYNRTEDDFEPQLHVWYHLEKGSDKIKGIQYNWGLYNPSFNPSKEKKKLKSLAKKEKVFQKKYNTLKKEIQNKLGEPIKTKVIADNKNSYIENVFWEDEEKIVGLSIKFSRKLKEIPGIGIMADFRIGVMITYK